MGNSAKRPEYTGIDKYPGWTATIITVIIGAVFILALINEGSHGGHHGEHDAAHGEANHGDDHGHKDGHDAKVEHKEKEAH